MTNRSPFLVPTLDTPQLRLVCCDFTLLEAILGDNGKNLSEYLGVNVPEKWSEFGDVAFRWTYDWLKRSPFDARWYSYLPILKTENTLVGSCGYKGGPDLNGMVEIGYEVAEAYRQQGLATEMAQALIDFAFGFEDVKIVQAHTLAEENPSVKILKKCGMSFVKELNDPEDGLIWQWQLEK